QMPDPNSKYWAAAKAALSFGKGVNTSTGNTKDSVNELRASHVYGTVGAHSGEAPHVSDDEAFQALSGDDGGGGRDAGVQSGWIVLDEEDRVRIARFKARYLRDEAANAAVRGETLFDGLCTGEITGATVVVRFAFAEDGVAKPVAADVDLPS